MLNYQEMADFLGIYLDKFKDCYYQSTAILGLLDFVKGRGIGRAIEEWDYESLPQTGIGRPKQADLTIVNKGVLKTLIEIQVAYDRPYDARRLIYDLIKLESVRKDTNKQVDRLLVIVGSRYAYQKHFMHESSRGRIPAHLGLLPVRLGERKNVDLAYALPYSRELLTEYSEKLRIEIPQSITTTMVGDYSSPYIRIGIWRVGKQNRREVIPTSFFLNLKTNCTSSNFATI